MVRLPWSEDVSKATMMFFISMFIAKNLSSILLLGTWNQICTYMQTDCCTFFFQLLSCTLPVGHLAHHHQQWQGIAQWPCLKVWQIVKHKWALHTYHVKLKTKELRSGFRFKVRSVQEAISLISGIPNLPYLVVSRYPMWCVHWSSASGKHCEASCTTRLMNVDSESVGLSVHSIMQRRSIHRSASWSPVWIWSRRWSTFNMSPFTTQYNWWGPKQNTYKLTKKVAKECKINHGTCWTCLLDSTWLG